MERRNCEVNQTMRIYVYLCNSDTMAQIQPSQATASASAAAITVTATTKDNAFNSSTFFGLGKFSCDNGDMENVCVRVREWRCKSEKERNEKEWWRLTVNLNLVLWFFINVQLASSSHFYPFFHSPFSTWCACLCPFVGRYEIKFWFWVQEHQIISSNVRACVCTFPCRSCIFLCFLHFFMNWTVRHLICADIQFNIHTHITQSLGGTSDFWTTYRFYFSVECCTPTHGTDRCALRASILHTYTYTHRTCRFACTFSGPI